MNIKKRARILYLFFLVFFFARAAEVFGLEKFFYGSSTKGASNAYAFIGIEREIFVKEGVEFTPLYMGIPPARAALVSGDVHGISYNPASPKRGAPEVQVFSLNKSSGWFLMTKPSIRDFKQLVGKNIAVGSIGTTAYQLTQWILARNGVDPNAVTFVGGRGGSAVRVQMLLAGAIDGVVLVAPYNKVAQQKGFYQLGDYTSVPLMQNGLTVNRLRLKTQGALVKRVLRGMVKSLIYTMSHRSETVAWLTKHTGVNKKDAETVFDTMVDTTTQYGMPPVDAVENFIKFSGVPKEQIGEFNDYSLLKEVLEEMGIKTAQ
jgi:ABC-type nitrate/sulfonate/bicarbonate transport system substrate-binding protein